MLECRECPSTLFILFCCRRAITLTLEYIIQQSAILSDQTISVIQSASTQCHVYIYFYIYHYHHIILNTQKLILGYSSIIIQMRTSYSTHKKHKPFIVATSSIQITIIILYAIFGNILINDQNLWKHLDNNPTKFYYYFLMNLNNIYFTILLFAGFGLILTYIKHSSWSALAFSLFITSLCVQLYPLLATFWNCVFIDKFNNQNVILDPLFSINGCIRVAISLIVVLAALIGRIGLLHTLIVGIFGTIVYSLNVSLNIMLAVARSPAAFINDVGGAVDIFLFGGILGAVIGRFISTQYSIMHPRYTLGAKSQTHIFPLVGTMFLWCGFFYLSVNDPIHQKYMDLGVLNTFLCMASCVTTLVGLSAIINKKIGIFQIVFGTISGGVIVGSCSMIMVNPFISILLGVVAGSLTYLYLYYCHKWINMKGVVDSTGVIGVYIINGILSPVFSAILIAIYASFPTQKPLFLGTTIGVDGGFANATYQLVHLSVTAAIALLTGLFMGIVIRCLNPKQQPQQLFDDFDDFGINYQLSTMPTFTIVAPPKMSKFQSPLDNLSETRLFGMNDMQISSNNIEVGLPQVATKEFVNAASSQITPPKSKINEHSVPLSPIKYLQKSQIKSIIYQSHSNIIGSAFEGISARPPSIISTFEVESPQTNKS